MPVVLLVSARWVSAQEQTLPRDVGADANEPSPTLVATAVVPDTSKSSLLCRCEHSKLIAQDADPLGKGAWQLQFNIGYSRATRQWDPDGWAESRERSSEWINQEVLTYGVSDTLDVGLGLGYGWLADDETGLKSGRGISDLALSGKWRFYENEDWGVAFAYVPTLTIPTGKETTSERLGPSQEFWSLDTRFAVVKDWSERWSTNVDAGYTAAFGERDEARGSFSANGAVGYRLFPLLQPEVELNYSHDFVHRDDDADLIAVTVGAEMPISDRLCVRAGVQRAIAGRNTDAATTFLLSVDLNF